MKVTSNDEGKGMIKEKHDNPDDHQLVTPPNSLLTKRSVEYRGINSDAKRCKLATKQSHFSSTKTIVRTVCPECHLSYVKHIKLDQQLHEKFHRRAMEGIEIGGQQQVMKFGRTVQEFEMSSNLHAKVVEADPRNRRAVQIIRESLELVNKELNAPKDNESWSIDGGLKGKVFVCICKSRIVGVCSTDKPSRGYWMVYETGSLVPRQTLKLQIGISRIYVSHKFRRHGIGLKLLQAVAKNSYYGLTLKGHQIGWSQPSQFGGLLAKRFNGVKHPASGKILIPVYKEEEC